MARDIVGRNRRPGQDELPRLTPRRIDLAPDVVPDLWYDLPLIDQARSIAGEDEARVEESYGARCRVGVQVDLTPCDVARGLRLSRSARTFDQDRQLPGQYFFTVTPGVVGAAAWHFTPRLAVVARARIGWLFYNIDKNMSLGYADGLIGVEYALSD